MKNKLDDASKIGGLLVGVYTGGTPNLASLKIALSVNPSMYISVHTSDIIVSSFYLLFIITIAKKVFGKFLPAFDKSNVISEISSKEEKKYEGILTKENILSFFKQIFIDTLIFSLSYGISLLFNKNTQTIILILGVTSFGILGSLIKPLQKIKNSFAIGQYFIMVFCLIVGSMANIQKLIMGSHIASFIFDFAKNWAKEKEKIYLHGPLGFTNFDTQGLLIEGFNKIPTTASVYNFEYYKDFFEKYGFKKEIDWVEYEIKVPDKIPEKALKIAEIVNQRYNIKVINFKCKKDLLNYAKEVFDLINITYKDLFSAVQLNDELIEHYINSYIKKIEPQLVKVAVNKNDKVIGFVISMPSLSLAMQKAKGRLFPFGFLYLLNAMKKYDKLDLYLGAVHPDYQGKGITALLMVEMTRTAIDKRIKTVETNSELENNIKVQRNWDYFDTTLIKRKRSYIIKF